MKSCKIIDIPNFGDERGYMSVLDDNQALPFRPKRLFYSYGVPADQVRGKHANIKSNFLMVAVSGSVKVLVDDGKKQESFVLNDPTKGLFIKKGTWKEMSNFSKDAVLLVIADTNYDKSEYITDYDEFKKAAK